MRPSRVLVALALALLLAVPLAAAESRTRLPGVTAFGGEGRWDNAIVLVVTTEGGVAARYYNSTLQEGDAENLHIGMSVKTCTWTVRIVPDTCVFHEILV